MEVSGPTSGQDLGQDVGRDVGQDIAQDLGQTHAFRAIIQSARGGMTQSIANKATGIVGNLFGGKKGLAITVVTSHN